MTHTAGGVPAPRPAGALAWLGRLTARHPWPVLVIAALFVVFAGLTGRDAASHLSSGGFTDPNAQSTKAGFVLARTFGVEDPSFVVLVTARHGTVDNPAATFAGRRIGRGLRQQPGVAGVQSYWSKTNPHSPDLVSRDHQQAVIVGFAKGSAAAQNATTQWLATQERSTPALRVQVGGAVLASLEATSQTKKDLVSAESIALLLTLVLLVLAFRGLIAGALPLVIGIIAIAGSLLVLRGLASVTNVSLYALNLTSALGLGLGIDYALLLVSRFREELAAGLPTEAAVVETVRTAGRTVLFSAATVAVSLLALLLFPEYFLSSFGYAGMAVVVLAAGSALLVVPALLAVLGPRINRFSVPLRRRGPAAQGGKDGQPGWWQRFSAFVMRFPVRIAVAVTLVLVVFGLPFSHVTFGLPDDRVLPTSAPARQVGDALRANFGAFATAPVDVVAAGVMPAARWNQVAAYATTLSTLPGTAQVQARTGTYAAGRRVVPPTHRSLQYATTWGTWFRVVPSVDPSSGAAEDLVSRIRAMHGPFPVALTGLTAQQADTVASVSGRLPLALGLIALVTFLALFLMTGSLVIPAKAVVLSAMSLTATFGVAVWVFQEGHLSSVLNFTATGTLDVSTLLLMFCLAFGLSMDYQVFLLSRITEEHRRSGDTTAAVGLGLERTGRIVTTAAALLAIVFIALATSGISLLKLLGAGIAVALIVDATLIRALLLPALMRLLGSVNWWAPAPLRRLHAAVGFSESPEPGPATAASRPRSAPAPRSQVAAAATAAPAAATRDAAPGSPSSRDSAAAQAPQSCGETSTAPGPQTSASAGTELATTGTPAAMASSAGSPNPSASEGNANTDAARYTAGSTPSGTSGSSRTRDPSPSPEISPGTGSEKFGSE
jgi:putative drug exporter of the RND superfamily